MNFLKKNLNGILVCFVIAVPSWLLGKTFPVVGGPVIAILAGMLITLVWTNKGKAESGIKWTYVIDFIVKLSDVFVSQYSVIV